jgi:transcription termination factor NusB
VILEQCQQLAEQYASEKSIAFIFALLAKLNKP